MTTGKMVLQAPHGYIPELPGTLLPLLVELKLIGAAYPRIPGSYLAGPEFLQLIGFLGCSPNLRLEPPADGSGDFCRIRFLGPFEKPRLLCDENTRPPRCPACGKGLTRWRQLEADWSSGQIAESVRCTSCGRDASPCELNWRRKAGFANFFVEISGIFPEEAVPLPSLIKSLHAEGGEWRYFYLHSWTE